MTTISISGFATASFTDTTGEASNQKVQIAGESDFALDSAILGVQSNAFQDYNLSTFIGPIVGSPIFNPNQAHPTTSGNFSLSNIQFVSFQAQIVPEPSSYLLMIAGTLIPIGRFFWKCLSRSGVSSVR